MNPVSAVTSNLTPASVTQDVGERRGVEAAVGISRRTGNAQIDKRDVENITNRWLNFLLRKQTNVNQQSYFTHVTMSCYAASVALFSRLVTVPRSSPCFSMQASYSANSLDWHSMANFFRKRASITLLVSSVGKSLPRRSFRRRRPRDRKVWSPYYGRSMSDVLLVVLELIAFARKSRQKL
ncbi:unnamed protein product [Clavelina lepadiformis]|uniref:Uncharacterized protein n=1 Tax=Clavelina lepadiformis TaxID=159417 RepID=A0ABP0GEB2_CLALP